MNRYSTVFLLYIFFSYFSIYADKSCLSDENCPKYYYCSYGACVIDDAVFSETEYISIYEGIVAEKEEYSGYKVTRNESDVVLGSITLDEEVGSGDSPSMIERINFKFEKSDNIEIENVRLIYDVNGNGEYDSSDLEIMNEPADSYGTKSRFIEYSDRAELLDIDGEMNFLIVADYSVDRSDNTWPAFVKIESVESMIFSSNVIKKDESFKLIEFDAVTMPPWGEIVFFDSSNANFNGSTDEGKLNNVIITSIADTVLTGIDFNAEESGENTYWGPHDGYVDMDGTFFLKLEDEESGEKIYSIESDGYSHDFDVYYHLKANVPVKLTIEYKGKVCGSDIKIRFLSDSLRVSEDNFKFVGLPDEIYGSASIDYDVCSHFHGCSLLLF